MLSLHLHFRPGWSSRILSSKSKLTYPGLLVVERLEASRVLTRSCFYLSPSSPSLCVTAKAAEVFCSPWDAGRRDTFSFLSYLVLSCVSASWFHLSPATVSHFILVQKRNAWKVRFISWKLNTYNWVWCTVLDLICFVGICLSLKHACFGPIILLKRAAIQHTATSLRPLLMFQTNKLVKLLLV